MFADYQKSCSSWRDCGVYSNTTCKNGQCVCQDGYLYHNGRCQSGTAQHFSHSLFSTDRMWRSNPNSSRHYLQVGIVSFLFSSCKPCVQFKYVTIL